MAFTVQDDEGTVAGANSYDEIAEFKSYHDDRGNDFSAFSDTQIEVGMVKGTDYIDVRFNYSGCKRNNRQVTQFPRSELYDEDDDIVIGIPHEIKEANYEYAFRSLSAELMPDPSQTGDQQALRFRTEKVGPIARTLNYVGGGIKLPQYPEVDLILINSGLVLTQDRTIERG